MLQPDHLAFDIQRETKRREKRRRAVLFAFCIIVGLFALYAMTLTM